MVTPTSLNAAGCALALPAASVDASNRAANAVVFILASLSSPVIRRSVQTLSARGDARKQDEAGFLPTRAIKRTPIPGCRQRKAPHGEASISLSMRPINTPTPDA